MRWLILAAAIVGFSAYAQEPSTLADAAPSPFVPKSPAIQALGTNPSGIMRPGSVRAAAADLFSAVDENGKIQNGVAIEVAPLWLLLGPDITLREWRTSYGARAASRLSLSAATSVDAASNAARLAQGLKWTFFDKGDPRWDKGLEDCLVRAMKDRRSSGGGGSNTAAEAEAEADEGPIVIDNPRLAKCREPTMQGTGQGSGGSIALAVTQLSESGQASRARAELLRGWASLSINAGDLGGSHFLQFTGTMEFRRSFTENKNDLATGVRVRIGNQSWGIAADAAWTPQDIGHEFQGEAAVVQGIVEAMVSDQLWLIVNVGGKPGTDAPGSKIFGGLNFKASFGEGRKVELL
ncbi:hypothetical protein ACN47A_00875 [Myxococcus fulvus]|uniref:hypothetical protein n=1 Tax=Myxococcus fulvus TaxID=33 RepID=UPI003B9C4286